MICNAEFRRFLDRRSCAHLAVHEVDLGAHGVGAVLADGEVVGVVIDAPRDPLPDHGRACVVVVRLPKYGVQQRVAAAEVTPLRAAG